MLLRTPKNTIRYSALRLVGTALMIGLGSGSTALLSAAPPLERSESAGTCAGDLGRLQPLYGAELESELEIISWNIQKAGSEGWADDLATIGEGVHLAFIQEASAEAAIESVFPRQLHPSFSQGYTTATTATGVMTLSAGLPSLRCNFTAQEPWLGTPKATAVTEHPLRGRDDRLLAINLHAVNFELGLESLEKQFSTLGDLLQDHSGPIILAGDFNTWSQQREQLVQEFLTGYGLNPIQFLPDLRTRTFGRALDHIYVRGIDTAEAWVVPVTTSDHNPLRARLRLQ